MSAEGRVENQKLNQTAALLSLEGVFGIQLDSLEKKLTTLPGFTITRLQNFSILSMLNLLDDLMVALIYLYPFTKFWYFKHVEPFR